MKKMLLAVLLAAATGSVSFAQSQRPGMKDKTPEERAQATTDRMEQTLKLTPDQKKEVYKLNLQAAQQSESHMKVIRSEKAQVRGIHEEKETGYKKVLTQEQMQRYEQMKAQRRERMAARMKPREGRPMQQPAQELQKENSAVR